MNKAVCIHGHFYQPPRENPWLETVEVQDSAYPFHDWNERVTAESYAPNGASRVLDDQGFVTQIVNNYSRISFNFGPTLLSWMEAESPTVYDAILEADRLSIERFSGHGSAMAQAYNHLIMPLANPQDKRTQILWGIRDFEARFKRKPEGMWLPEAAVDTESLELMAEYGIRFTVLAPRQAASVRKIGERRWHDTSDETVDPRRPYIQKLPSGREIVLFFYDGGVSRDVAFNQLLNEGSVFADRLMSAFDSPLPEDQLVHIATDGETYGHHHRFGDMALASALNKIDQSGDARVTIYAEYLDTHEPQWEAQIVENSSWSCVHGVERWKANCGCNAGGHAGWTQNWRGPLRDALDWLRDDLNPRYEQAASELFKDPWQARDQFIDVVLDRSPDHIQKFLAANSSSQKLSESDTVRALKLLELQRHLMLTYTSCGWFFDELSGIETVQVIEYAGRVVQLATDLFGTDVETEFINRLSNAKSNLPSHVDGGNIYKKWVKPAVVGIPAVAANAAISSLFQRNGNGPNADLAAYDVQFDDPRTRDMGRARLCIGKVSVTSRITMEHGTFRFAALHLGDHNVSCGVLPLVSDEEFKSWAAGFDDIAGIGDLPALVRAFDTAFGAEQYSLRSLFRDEQRRVLNLILQNALEGAEGVYQGIYEQQVPVMRFLTDVGSPVPQAFKTAAEYFLNSILRRELEREDRAIDFQWLRMRLDDATQLHIELDLRGLGLLLERVIDRKLRDLRSGLVTVEELEQLEAMVDLAYNSQLEVDLWHTENLVFEMAHSDYVKAVEQANGGDDEKGQWAELFRSVASHVSVRLPSV